MAVERVLPTSLKRLETALKHPARARLLSAVSSHFQADTYKRTFQCWYKTQLRIPTPDHNEITGPSSNAIKPLIQYSNETIRPTLECD